MESANFDIIELENLEAPDFIDWLIGVGVGGLAAVGVVGGTVAILT